MQAGTRLTELDGLRGVAVSMVLAYHYTTRYGELFPQDAWGGFALGNYGVHVFFIISGFVIFMTLERCARPADFVLARFSRLYPAYWSAVAITSLALWLLAGPVTPPSLREAALNLSMLQGFLHVPLVDGVYWSLEVELLFYALALAAFSAGLLARVHWPLLAWLALAALFDSPLWPARIAALPFAPLAARLLVLEFAPFFALGVLFYRLRRGEGCAAWNYALIAFALALVAASEPLSVTLMIALACIALWKLVRGGLALLRLRPLVLLGAISYPLYLVHQKIGHAVLFALARHGWAPPARVAAAVAGAIALAALVTLCVERPAMRAIRRGYDALRFAPRQTRNTPLASRSSSLKPRNRALSRGRIARTAERSGSP